MSFPRFAFAGDRDISVRVLDHLLDDGARPLALLVSDSNRASHDDALIDRCPFLNEGFILRGKEFRASAGFELLRACNLDFLIAVHFPYIIPKCLLDMPRHGVLNLHPAYLPYNRGWHTPSWALMNGTPYGATLHFMSDQLDQGDIVRQKEIAVLEVDTAHSLYQRVKDAEFEVFCEAWPLLKQGTYPRTPQPLVSEKAHKREDLFKPEIQELPMDAEMRVRDLIRRLRALTTNRTEEAAYMLVDGRRYHVRLVITDENALPKPGKPQMVATE